MACSVTPTAVSPALSLDMEPSAWEKPSVAGHPGGPPGEQPRGVDLDGHVGQLEGDPLVLDDRLPEL